MILKYIRTVVAKSNKSKGLFLADFFRRILWQHYIFHDPCRRSSETVSNKNLGHIFVGLATDVN